MKKYLSKIITLFLLSLLVSFIADAQFVIKVRPVAPVVRVHPLCPSPRHVWVNGEYIWRGDRYEYIEGYWGLPPEHRNHWIDGRWRHRRGGWIWIPGHWR